MARSKKSSSRPSADPPSLEEVVEELTGEVQNLTGHVEVLRIAIDDLRQEVEWAIRNLARPAWAPIQTHSSVPQDVPSGVVEPVAKQVKTEDRPPETALPVPPVTAGSRQRGLFD